MPTYFKVLYDTQLVGQFTSDHSTKGFTELTWTGGGRGHVIQDFDDGGDTGKLHVALLAGAIPQDGETMTQGTTTAIPNGDGTTLLYPAYFRLDVDITQDTPTAGETEVDWDAAGGAPVAAATSVGEELDVLPTHSFFYDGFAGTAVATGDVLTFANGATAEVINLIGAQATDGELEVRITSNLDAGLPVDSENFTVDGASGDGEIQGEMNPRSYLALNLHRLLADLNDDGQFVGDDDLSMLDPTPSAKDTDQIVRLIGGAHATDTLIDHMFGGSVAQTAGVAGDVKFGGLDVQVTSPNAATRPVLIQFDATSGLDVIIPDNYSTAWNPDSIAGNIRKMIKIRENGVDIDGRRVKGKLLEYGDTYFEGSTTLGDATTSLAVFASTDGNNTTPIDTVKLDLSDITEGFTTQTYGTTTGDFAAILNYQGETSGISYEVTKWIQARVKTTGTVQPTLFGRDGRLVTGVNRNFAYSGAGALTENNTFAWGTEIVYTGLGSGPFVEGEVVSFVGSGALGRVYYDDAVDFMIVGDVVGIPLDTDTLTTVRGAAETTASGITTVSLNARFGIGLLMAFDDDGATGNVYYQALAGLDPVNGQDVYDRTTDATVTINSVVASRTINNQWVGNYTGTNFQTNFGIGILSTDAVLGDLNRDLLGAEIGVPNNQSGAITNLRAGDRVTCYPWDGSTVDVNGDAVPDTTQMTIASANLTGAAVTSITVDAIPDNSPATGQIRVTRNSGIVSLINYSDITGVVLTITATDFSGDNANIGNGVMFAYLDLIQATGTDGSPGSASFTSVYGPGDTVMTATVRRGSNNPIVPFKTNPTFGLTGFSVAAGRISDA